MKASNIAYLILPGFVAALPGSEAQEPGAPPSGGDAPQLKVESQKTLNPNRFSLSSRFALNIEADFDDWATWSDAGPPAGAANRTYDNGFVQMDASGSSSLTWYWQYQGAVDPAGLIMRSSTAPSGGGVRDAQDDPHLGLEVTYARELGSIRSLKYGFEAAFGWTDVRIASDQSISGPVTVTTDTFSLGGIVMPADGNRGSTFEGPGPLIPLNPGPPLAPGRQTQPSVATVGGMRTLDASLYGFRLGPYFEVPLAKRLTFGLSGGLALAVVDSEFSFSETKSVPGFNLTSQQSGRSSDSDLLAGGYVQGLLSLGLSDTVSLSAGVQYQSLGDFTQRAGVKEAKLDLGNSIFVTVGLGFSF